MVGPALLATGAGEHPLMDVRSVLLDASSAADDDTAEHASA
jgi:hypothetical protein